MNEKILTLPNLLTIFRLVSVMAFLVLAYVGQEAAALFLGLFAIVSDAADGIIARKFQQATVLGSILDQIIDSITIAALLIFGVYLQFFPIFLPIFFLLREFWVIAIRQYSALYQIRIPSSWLGKTATCFTALGLLLSYLSIFQFVPHLSFFSFLGWGIAIITFGVSLSCAAAIFYTRQFILKIKQSRSAYV